MDLDLGSTHFVLLQRNGLFWLSLLKCPTLVCLLSVGRSSLGIPPFGSLKDWDIASMCGSSLCIASIVEAFHHPCLHLLLWYISPLILMVCYSVSLGILKLPYFYWPGGSYLIAMVIDLIMIQFYYSNQVCYLLFQTNELVTGFSRGHHRFHFCCGSW